jgi:hypothetical protein
MAGDIHEADDATELDDADEAAARSGERDGAAHGLAERAVQGVVMNFGPPMSVPSCVPLPTFPSKVP